jgi:hypothetical protein
MTGLLPAHRAREYSLRSNAPIPGVVTESWLHFAGVELLAIEEVWNDTDTRGTRLDGEILNRIALYGVIDSTETGCMHWFRSLGRRRQSVKFAQIAAEVRRYNPRVVFLPPGRERNGPNPLPLYSKARQFVDLQAARDWLECDAMLDEGTMRDRVSDGLDRLTIDDRG